MRPTPFDSPFPTREEWENIYRVETEREFDSDEAVRYNCRLVGFIRDDFVKEYVRWKMFVLFDCVEEVKKAFGVDR